MNVCTANPRSSAALEYSGCTLLTGPEFENVFYRQLWASNVKLVSYYMFYGGTSWGALPYGYVFSTLAFRVLMRMLNPVE